MDFSLSEQRSLLRETVQRFVEENCNREQVAQWDADHIWPEGLYQLMAEAGWLGLMVPEEWGGAGGSIEDVVVIFEALSRYSKDIPNRIALTAWGQQNLILFGTDDQRERLLRPSTSGEIKFSFALTEAESGSDAASLTTRAVQQANGSFLANGAKLFCSGADAPDTWIVLAARTDVGAPKHEGISLFLVPNDAPGLEVRRMDTIGNRLLGTCELFLDDVSIPAENLLGPLNGGWQCILSHLVRERILLSAVSVGCLAAVVEDASMYANDRVAFGKPIIRHQAIGHMLADMAVSVDAARWLAYRAAWQYAKGEDASISATMAKLFASEALVEASTNGMQILGGHAYTTDHAMQRYWREARNTTVGGGSSQIMRNILARDLASGDK